MGTLLAAASACHRPSIVEPGSGFSGVDLDSAPATPAVIVIQNGDPPGWGLNDARPFQAVGGNSARTLGEARMNGARRAAQVWSAVVQSKVPIVLKVSFNHEPCGAPGLANGSPNGSQSGFPGARPGVRYPTALANAIAGADLNGSAPEGGIEMLAVFDDQPKCLGGSWYYGFDHPNEIARHGLDYVSVLLHEMGHALGFGSSASASSVSPFELSMYDETLHAFWADLTPAQRQRSAKNVHNLTWNGPATNLAAARYPALTTNGHLRLDANTSALSHWEAAGSGGLLMTGSGSNEARSDFVDVTSCVLQDMGWTLMPGRCPDVGPPK